MQILIYCLVGFATSVIAAMGLGGGTVFLTAAVMFFGFPQMQAQGINLLLFIPSAVIATIINSKNGLIQKEKIGFTAVFGCLFAVLGFLLAKNIDKQLISKIFALFLIFAGLKELFTKEKEDSES